MSSSTMISPFLEVVSDEILVEVLRWLPPLDLLTQTARVSTRFAALLRDVAFWQKHDLLLQSSLQQQAGRPALNLEQLQRLCLFVAAQRERKHADAALSAIKAPACLHLGSVLTNRDMASTMLQISQGSKRACLASTTDNPDELVENVLVRPASEKAVANDFCAIPHGRNTLRHTGLGRAEWWSSAPTPSSDTTETLIFTTKYPLALISQICIKPLRDPDPFRRDKVYNWKHTTVRAYQIGNHDSSSTSVTTNSTSSSPPETTRPRPLSSVRTNNHRHTATATTVRASWSNGTVLVAEPMGTSFSVTSQEPAVEGFLANHKPVYTSPAPIPSLPPHETEDETTDNNDDWITVFDAMDAKTTMGSGGGGGILANVICLTLQGKYHEQFNGYGYYACVERVFVRGIPLEDPRTAK